MNEQTQGKVVHLLALGKGKRLAHETTQALAQGAVPALDVAGLPLAFVAAAMRALGEKLPRTPARSHCGWPGSDSPVGCVLARPGHSRPSGPRRSRPRSDGSGGRERSRPSADWLWSRRSSRVHRVQARRLSPPAARFHSGAAGWRLFFQPPGDGLPGHAKEPLRGPQAQPFGGDRLQDQGLADRVGSRALGREHPMCPASVAKVLLTAARVVAAFDEGGAAASRTTGSRGIHAHSSLIKLLCHSEITTTEYP